MSRRDKNNKIRRERLQTEENRWKIFGKVKTWVWRILVVCVLGFALRWLVFHNLLNHFGVQEKGVVVNVKNWYGKYSKTFTYSYRFTVDGKTYTEDCKSNNHEIGEPVTVEYLDFCPSINRIKK
jgi:hypothetical protein